MIPLLLGALLGLLVTVALTVLLPPRWGHLRPLVAALAGFVVALILYWALARPA